MCAGFLVLAHFAQVSRLRRQLLDSQASQMYFRNESAALERDIRRLSDAAAEKAIRKSEAAQRYAQNDVSDPFNQIRFIELSAIRKKPVLNREETAIFGHCLAVIRGFRRYGRKLNICPQVSMGEMLGTPDDEHSKMVYSSFNTKRVDILICDDSWRPLIVIEHQGSGHTLGEDWAERDFVKARALERAGVRLIETGPEHCGPAREEFKAELETSLLDACGIASPAPASPPNTMSEATDPSERTLPVG
jgi:hypothetical protein